PRRSAACRTVKSGIRLISSHNIDYNHTEMSPARPCPQRLRAIAAIAIVAVAAAIPAGRVQAQRRPVRIAAASDLRFALEEVAARLRAARPGLEVQVTYGSSGTFFAQLTNGAPFDIFMSADTDYPAQLAARGLIVSGSEFTYAIGRLALWVGAAS